VGRELRNGVRGVGVVYAQTDKVAERLKTLFQGQVAKAGSYKNLMVPRAYGVSSRFRWCMARVRTMSRLGGDRRTKCENSAPKRYRENGPPDGAESKNCINPKLFGAQFPREEVVSELS